MTVSNSTLSGTTRHVCSVTSVVSNSLIPHGLEPVSLLCPWHSPGKNTGVGFHVFLQGIVPTQGLKLHYSPALASEFFINSATWEARGELNKGAVYKDVGKGGEIDKGWRPTPGAVRSFTSPDRKDIKGDMSRLCYQSKSKAPEEAETRALSRNEPRREGALSPSSYPLSALLNG